MANQNKAIKKTTSDIKANKSSAALDSFNLFYEELPIKIDGKELSPRSTRLQRPSRIKR